MKHGPEQACGGFPGPAAEVCSIGAVLFETAMGKIPFGAYDDGETEDEGELERFEQLERQTESVRAYRRVPAAFAKVVDACLLEPGPARRPTVEDLMRRLTAFN